MMKVLLIALALGVASATMTVEFKPSLFLDDHTVDLEDRFEAFEQLFTKTYESAEARMHAALNFAENDAFIKEHNAGDSSFTVGHNEFSDLSWDEFKALYVTGMATENLRGEKNYDMSLLTAPADASVDWVAKGAVTPVKNQGQCGSCWAFSTTGSTEGAFQIAGNPLTSFSEQDLVSCAASFGNAGCNGGLMDNGFKYIEKSGLALEKTYPYTGQTGKCDKSKQSQAVVTVTGYTDVPPKSTSALKAAATKGPVSVAIEADKQAFQLYKSGVFTSATCGTKLDHGVLVVGYGTESGKDYWKVKNSWGATWGASGYILIESGKNLCGITQSASYPTGAKKMTPGPAPPPSPPSPTPPAPTPTPGQTHYGNPANGCESDEQAVQIQGVSGDFCAPDCASAACPTDVPAGVTAAPQCALKSATGDKKCALICSATTDEASLRAGDAMCGTATCKAIGGTGICTYGAGPAPGPSPPATCGLKAGLECAEDVKKCVSACKQGAGACIQCIGESFVTCCPCILKLDPKLPITCGSVAPIEPEFMQITTVHM